MSISRWIVIVPVLVGFAVTGTAVARMLPRETVRDTVYQTCQHNGVHFNKQGHANCGLHKGWSDDPTTSTGDEPGSQPGDQPTTESGGSASHAPNHGGKADHGNIERHISGHRGEAVMGDELIDCRAIADQCLERDVAVQAEPIGQRDEGPERCGGNTTGGRATVAESATFGCGNKGPLCMMLRAVSA